MFTCLETVACPAVHAKRAVYGSTYFLFFKLEKVFTECKPPPRRHLEFQSRDHSIHHMPFPIGEGPLSTPLIQEDFYSVIDVCMFITHVLSAHALYEL